jgi:hypothetical protein
MSSDMDPQAAAPQRINLDEPAALERWKKELSATEAQLREAVAAVGDSASDVEMHLKGSRSSTNEDAAAGS